MSQAAFELIAARYPGAFAGYKMSVTESHQSSKVCCGSRLCCQPRLRSASGCSAAQADTSGTAKALVASFQKLGPKFEVDEIVKVRDTEQQLKMGVPGACCCSCFACLRHGERRTDVFGEQRRTWLVTPITHTG